MNTFTLQQFFINSSFISIFITTIFYFFNFTFLFSNKKFNIYNSLIFICFINIFFNLFIRWVETKHFPLSNLYESLIFLTFILTCFLIYYQTLKKKEYIGILLLPIILFINTFATFTLTEDMQQPTPLVPALQSNWLLMHVTIMILSYGALLVGSIFSIVFLVINYFFNKESFVLKNSFFNTNLLSISKDLDNLSYRTISFGFPLLTIGILSGSVWANETWGSYWNWDPKETWALITWLFYAIYLHSRIIKGWKGEKPAFIAAGGFVILWICYLGVNIFGKGLHSYGWFFTN